MQNIEAMLLRHQYALVDRLAVGEDAYGGLPVEPLIPRELHLNASLMPGLLPLGPDVPYLQRLIENIEDANRAEAQHLLSALLVVPEDTAPERLQAHLRKLIRLYHPGGRYFLRYFDPRVFPHLVFRILRAGQVKHLFGPIQEWAFRFQSEWINVPKPEEEEPAPALWAVTARQMSALDDVAVLNMAFLKRNQTLKKNWKNFDEWREAADTGAAALHVARLHHQLKDTDDLTAFTCHAILHGANFHRHETL